MPTGLELFGDLLDKGLSPEEAKIGMTEYLGFTPTMSQLSLSAEELQAMRPGATAAQQQPRVAGVQYSDFIPQPSQPPAFRGAGATATWDAGDQPTPAERRLLEGGLPTIVKPQEQRVAEMGVDDRPTLFNPPEETESLIQRVAEPVAKAAGVVAGVPMAPIDVGMEVYDRLADNQGFTSIDEPTSSTQRRSALTQVFNQSREQLKKESEYRLNEDIYDNWRANVADLSEGTIDLFLELADLKDKGSESTLDGMTRAFKEGLALPAAMFGGGAAFLTRLAEAPITTMRTHPADALLTILPMAPKVGALAKAGNARAIRAMKELEQTGLVRAATAVAEAPSRIAQTPVGNLKVRDRVIESRAGDSIELSGGERALTVGDLASSAAKGATAGLMFDEALAGGLLTPAFKVLQARFPGISLTAFRRIFTDIAAQDNPRAEALTRIAIEQPNRLAQTLLREVEALEGVGENLGSTPLEPGPYKPEIGTGVSVKLPDGTPVPQAQAALKRQIRSERFDPSKNRPVSVLTPDQSKLFDKMAGALKSGLSRGREDIVSGVRQQVDRTDMYLSQMREILTGDSMLLLDDKAVNGAVMKFLVSVGMSPEMAGSKLRLLQKEAADGRVAELKIQMPKGWTPDELDTARGFRIDDDVKNISEGNLPSPPVEVDIRDIIARSVYNSKDAQKSILSNTVKQVARNEKLNQRTKILADTVSPILDIFEEKWLRDGGTNRAMLVKDPTTGRERWVTDPDAPRKDFDKMALHRPEAFSAMVQKIYGLQKGLEPGNPVLFMPLQEKGLTPTNINDTLQGANLDMVARDLSRNQGIPFRQAKDELVKLRRELHSFERVDEIGGYLPPPIAKAFRLIDKAESVRADMSDTANKYSNHMKKALTVLNLSSGVNNITANVLLQSITRGTPMSMVVKDMATTGMDYRKYKNKGGVGSDAAMMYRSLEDTGVLDNDMIAVETNLYKGESLGSRLAKPFETFYRQGDALPKLDESVRVYKKTMQDLDKIADGESVTMLVDSNTAVSLKRKDGRFIRDGKAVTDQQLSDIVARGAAMAAENKFFNYNDTGALSKWLRGSGMTTAISPFYTWFSKALAGRRGGLAGNVLMGEFSPIVTTDSVAVLRGQLADAALQSGRRAAFSQAGSFEDRAVRDAYRDVLSFDTRRASPVFMDAPDSEGVSRAKSLEFIDFSGPISLGLRAASGLLTRARGDTDAKNLIRLQSENDPESKRRASLALKELRGERFTWEDGMELIGLSGGPAMELMDALRSDMKDEWGRERNLDQLLATFGSAVLGGTLSKGVLTALATGPETSPEGFLTGDYNMLPPGVAIDPELRETVRSFVVRRMIGLAPKPRRLLAQVETNLKTGKQKVSKKGAVDYYIKNLRDTLRKATVNKLKKRAENREVSGRDNSELLDEIELWEDIIDQEVELEKDRLEEAEFSLQK
jgi:hypothetical protein